MKTNQKFCAIACVIVLSACSSTGASMVSAVQQESSAIHQGSQLPVSSSETRIDYPENSSQLRDYSSTRKMSDLAQQSGPGPTSSKVMLYSDYLRGLKEGVRTDVALGRVVQVETSALSSPTSLASGAVFTSGVKTVVLDAVSGDVLLVRLSGPSTAPVHE
jgi:hypothetical protein